MGEIYSHKQAKNLRNLMEGIIWFGLECWDLIDKFAWGSRLCDRATAVMIN